MPAVEHDSSGHGKPNRDPITTPDLFETGLPGLRHRLGWTQEEMGSFFGVSKLAAHRWEKNGAGETEARKAALRLLSSTLERSSASPGRVGEVLLEAGVAQMVTGAAHRSPFLEEGALDVPIDWKTVFGARDRLGWTQTELARFLGVTHSVPAVWESGDGNVGDATRAALLALDLTTRPGRPGYPEPDTPWTELKTEGLQSLYDEICALRIEPDL